MNAEFLALAFGAAVNPSLLAIDLVLLANSRPRAMLACLLIGGIGMAVTIGLVDVLVVRSDVVKSQGSLGRAGGLAIGLLLLGIGALLITGHLGRRHKARPGAGQPSQDRRPEQQSSWTQRALRKPRLALAIIVGAVLGLPGAIYLTALHNLVNGKSSTANQVVSVFVFAIIEFALLIIPLVLLTVRPASAAPVLRRAQAWLVKNGRELLAYTALGLGGYLTVGGIVSLAGLKGNVVAPRMLGREAKDPVRLADGQQRFGALYAGQRHCREDPPHQLSRRRGHHRVRRRDDEAFATRYLGGQGEAARGRGVPFIDVAPQVPPPR